RVEGARRAERLARGIGRFLGGPREAVASGPRAIARPSGQALSVTEREAFDIWHEVPLVPQLTGMSCWAAAAAMIVGWRECIDIDAEELAAGMGRWAEFHEGLEPTDIEALAEAWDLIAEPTAKVSVASLRRLLVRYGP